MDCSSFLQIIGSIFWNTIYKMCLHIYTSTHLRLHFSKSKVKGFDTACILIFIFMDCFSFLQIVGSIFWNTIYKMCLHNYTSTHLHIYTSTHLRLHIVKSTPRSKVKGFHTACILIFIFMDCFSFLKIVGFIFWNTIYKMCLHIYTSTHLRLHISKSKVKGFGTHATYHLLWIAFHFSKS